MLLHSSPISTIEGMQSHRASLQHARQTIALVPTMGNLHDGHLALVTEAASRADRVILSLFVNPTQFGPSEDFDRYPRTLEQDLAKLDALSVAVDSVFAPKLDAMYPFGQTDAMRISSSIGQRYCGASRPVFFSGILTIVNKLFQLIRPDAAIFGEKDFQQFWLIRAMVAEYFLPIDVIAYPIVREQDGLAMSSRNGYLSADQRTKAPMLYQTLKALAAQIQQDMITQGDALDNLLQHAKTQLTAEGFDVDYLTVCDEHDMSEVTTGQSCDMDSMRLLAAAVLGETRLIDNLKIND